GLMVLVDADAVEAELIGELELPDVAGVKLLSDRAIEIGIGQGDTLRLVALGVAEIQIRIGHEVKKERLHPFAPRKKASSRVPPSFARSIGSACPDTRRATGARAGRT